MKKLLAALALILGATGPAIADNYSVKDATLTPITFCAKANASILSPCHYLVDGSGSAFGVSANPLYIAGSIGNTSFGITGVTLSGGRIPVDGSGATQPISGSVTATGSALETGGNLAAAKTDLDAILSRTPTGNTQSAPGTSAPTANGMQGVTGGLPVSVDTVIRATSTDRSAIIGFTGAAITTTSGSPTITLTTAPTLGAVILGQQIAATGVPAGTVISTLSSGTLNAAGSTYALSANATATGSAVAATSVGPQQIMPANTARRGVAYQVQSTSANVWVNGLANATADYHSLKVASASYYESSPTHVGTGAASAISDTPATPLYAREW